jgi:hypothetical protein
MIISYNNSNLSLAQLIHEEEVRYNEAVRMKAGFDVLESIRVKIIELKAASNTSIFMQASDTVSNLIIQN